MTTEIQTRRCIGSSRFGIEAHDADPSDFPAQPSQKDGLGRMCKPHWREYTNALRKAAVAGRAEAAPEAPIQEPEVGSEVVATPTAVPDAEMPAPRQTRNAKAKAEPMEVDAA